MSITVKKYSATWCGPCQMLKPVFEKLQQTFISSPISFQNIDVDAFRDTAVADNVRSVPVVIISKNGIEVERIQGAKPATVYEQAIQKHLF